MNVLSTHRTLHPMQWVALIAVSLFAIVGIGAITGLIPVAKSQTEPQAIPQPATIPAPAAEAPVAQAAAPAPTPQVVVKTVQEPVHRHHTAIARNDPPPPPTGAVPPDYKPQAAPVCNDCGRIESVQRVMREGEGSGVGAVAGGVLGGALGNGVGQGNGRVLTTIAGAIGGALLGNKVEKSNKQLATYHTTVRFEDGTSRVFDSTTEPSWREGERVHLVNGELQPG